ncbi:MAG TPA: tetratricopeptide repeat protein, partial [Candidatus Eisenbacteria bacterium]|nr:tetratricopeptide repeat protein [Candidatus Eisenbacteria bacterium]
GMGNLLFDSHQWERAIEHYQKALDQNPKNGDVRVDMAIAYHQIGQNDRAAQEIQRVTKETPDHRNAWLNLGVVNAAMGDNAGAIRAWEQYLKLEPSSPHAAAIRAQIEDLKRGS